MGPTISDTKDQWSTLVNDQNDMFLRLLSHNAELEVEIAELKDEIELLHSGRKDMKAQITGLKIQLEEVGNEYKMERTGLVERINILEGYHPIALCLLDGDGCIFSQQYMRQGETGGSKAASELKKELGKHAGGGSLSTFIYLNQTGLRDHLFAEGICSPSEFNAFITGFNQSTELFSIVDVGRGKEAADAKIREMLKLFSGVPQVKKIFFGGGHDGGYRTVLNSLRTDGHEDKVVLLDFGSNARAIAELDLPRVSIPGLFHDGMIDTAAPIRRSSIDSDPSLSDLPPRSQTPLGSPPLAPASKIENIGSPALSYSSKASSVLSNAINLAPRTPPGLKPKNEDIPKIDRTKAMIWQTPTICNDHYLKSCFRFSCPYSHEYVLLDKDIAKLRVELKSIPCKGTRGCPGREECWYRH